MICVCEKGIPFLTLPTYDPWCYFEAVPPSSRMTLDQASNLSCDLVSTLKTGICTPGHCGGVSELTARVSAGCVAVRRWSNFTNLLDPSLGLLLPSFSPLFVLNQSEDLQDRGCLLLCVFYSTTVVPLGTTKDVSAIIVIIIHQCICYSQFNPDLYHCASRLFAHKNQVLLSSF